MSSTWDLASGMSGPPLVSIVIPVYNGAKYLAAAIDSALAQTYPHIEVVVIDDGSDDGGATAAIAAAYGDRVTYVRQANGGVAAALNRGIAAMRGTLFSWLSHDDLYLADKVERQVEAYLAFGQRCIVIGDFELFGEDGSACQRTTRGHNLLAKPLDAVFKGLINGCALLVPRSLFDDIGTFNTGLPTSQDYFLWYRMARAVPFVQCFHLGVRQRQHPEQGSRQISHLEEAGRTFIHLIEETPPEIMRGYSGSEARFLLDIRPTMSAYPAALAYLDRRLRELPAEEASSEPEASPSRRIWTAAPPLPEPVALALGGGKAIAWSDGIDEARVLAALTEGFRADRPVLLLLMHSIGGGSQTHVLHFAGALSRHANLLFAYGSKSSIRLSRQPATPEGGIVFDWASTCDALVRLLRLAGVSRIDIHSTYGFAERASAFLRALGLPSDFTVLDYDLFARHPHLAGADGRFVGDDELAKPASGHLRPQPHAIVRNASRLITLSRDTAARLRLIAPGLPVHCPDRWERPSQTVRHVFVPKLRPGEPLRIAVPGRIDRRKGSGLVVEAARLASRQKLPLHFVILGSLVEDEACVALAGDTLIVHGSYERGNFAAELSAAAPHVAWIPTQVPETWSYVLSELFGLAMPVAATSIGALRERCHGRPSTWLLPYDATAETWVDFFLRLRASDLTLDPLWPSIDDLPPSRPFYFDSYLEPGMRQR